MQSRHLAALLPAVEVAVVHGVDGSVACAALHCLHVVVVTCWPRFVGKVPFGAVCTGGGSGETVRACVPCRRWLCVGGWVGGWGGVCV